MLRRPAIGKAARARIQPADRVDPAAGPGRIYRGAGRGPAALRSGARRPGAGRGARRPARRRADSRPLPRRPGARGRLGQPDGLGVREHRTGAGGPRAGGPGLRRAGHRRGGRGRRRGRGPVTEHAPQLSVRRHLAAHRRPAPHRRAPVLGLHRGGGRAGAAGPAAERLPGAVQLHPEDGLQLRLGLGPDRGRRRHLAPGPVGGMEHGPDRRACAPWSTWSAGPGCCRCRWTWSGPPRARRRTWTSRSCWAVPRSDTPRCRQGRRRPRSGSRCPTPGSGNRPATVIRSCTTCRCG